MGSSFDWQSFEARTLVAQAGVDGVEVRGKDRIDLLHRLSTHDLRPLNAPGRTRTTVFATNKGKVVDWVWLLSSDDTLLLRASEGRGPRLCEWIGRFTIMEDVQCTDLGRSWSSLVVQGPQAAGVVGMDDLPAEGEVVQRDGVRWIRGLAAYGPRLEGFVPEEQAPGILDAALGRGAELAHARDLEVMRLRAGVPSPAFEFRDEVNVLEVGLWSAISWNKGCYIGQEVIARMDSHDKVARGLVGFEGIGAVEPGMPLLVGGDPMGRVTSCLRLDDDQILGLALVKRQAMVAQAASVETANGAVRVELRPRPFLRAP